MVEGVLMKLLCSEWVGWGDGVDYFSSWLNFDLILTVSIIFI